MRNGIAFILVLVISATNVLSQTTQPTTRPAPMPAEQMLNQMLAPSATGAKPLQPINLPPEVDRTTGGAAVAPAAPPMNVIREGSIIRDRTGRLTRSADAQNWEFTFDADSQAMADPPMVILPNFKLMQMENMVQSVNRDLRFRVTGEVTEYKGRNYLLLHKAVALQDVQQNF